MTEAEFLALDLDGSAPVDLAGALDAAIAYMDRQPVVEDAPEPPKPAWNRGVLYGRVVSSRVGAHGQEDTH